MLLCFFSQPFKYNDVAPSSPINYNSTVEQLQPEIFLPPLSPFGPGTLLISRDGEDDVSSVRISTARTSTTEVEFNNTNKKPPIYSKLSIPNNSNTQGTGTNGCDLFILLKTCWSWFCGLDESNAVDDKNDSSDGNVSYPRSQRKVENGNMDEGHDFMLQHNKESPIIKWILNTILVFLVLVEITLFVVFSLPVEYTFWRN